MEDLNSLPNNNLPFSDNDEVRENQAHPIADDKSQDKDENESQDENENSSDDSDIDLDSAFKCEVCVKTFSGYKPLLQHERSAKHYKMLQKKKVDKKISKKLEDDQSDDVLEDLVTGTYAQCETCKKQFSGPESHHQHLTSKVHKKKVAEIKFLKNITDSGKINVEKLKDVYKQRRTLQNDVSKAGAAGYSPTLEEIEDYEQTIADSYQFECKECDKKFTGVNPWYQHLVSKTHEKTLKQRQLFEKLNLGKPSASSVSAPTENVVSKDMDSIGMNDDVLTCQLCHMSFSGPESVFDHLKSRGHAKKKEIKEWKIAHSIKSTSNSAIESKRAIEKGNVSQVDEELGAATLTERQPQMAGITQLTEDLSERSATHDIDSNDPTVKVEGDHDSKAHNSLLCYESYKNYKKIMNEIESNGQLM